MTDQVKSSNHMLVSNHIKKLLKVLNELAEKADDSHLVIDVDFIRRVDKIVSKLTEMEADCKLPEPTDVELMVELATTMLSIEQKILNWYTTHKTKIIKIECDDSAEKEENKDEEDSVDLEIQDFSLVPILNLLSKYVKECATLAQKLKKIEENVSKVFTFNLNFQYHNWNDVQPLPKPVEEVEDNKSKVSVIIADWEGTIHGCNNVTSRLFHIDSRALQGKNFFQLMSSYSRKHCYEIYGHNMFKTFKETTRTIRFSLPHMDDVDYDHFFVLISKIALVKRKAASPLGGEPFMVRISTRVSSDTSKRRMFENYTKARAKLRSELGQASRFMPEIPIVNSMVPNGLSGPKPNSAFNT